MRFILALSPSKEFELFLISIAQALFAPFATGDYLISEKARPHITLFQFTCEDEQEALEIFSKIQEKFPSGFCPTLFAMSFIEKDGCTQAELSARKDLELIKMHLFAKKQIEERGLKGLTESEPLYRPHITLARLKLPPQITTWPRPLFENKDPFTLTLGLSDEAGQYLKQIK